jgi:signal peptidase II
MKILRKILLICISIICLVGCDYTSKKVAKVELKDQPVHTYLAGNLQFVYAENSGGMLSTGSKLEEKTRIVIYKYFVALMLILLFIFLIREKRSGKWRTIGLVLILSGGIGNLLDRFTNDGKVVDFIVVSMFNCHTGIFNIADLYITIGIIVIIVSSAFNKYYFPGNAI